MKRIKYFIIFFSFTSGLFAQRNSAKRDSYEFFLGSHAFTSNFYNQLNTTQNLRVSQPLQLAGIGLSGNLYITRRAKPYPAHWLFCQVIPSEIKIKDTIKGKITGNFFSFTIVGVDLFEKSENFDLVFSAGANWGRLRIYQNDFVRMKNIFFSPMVSIEPKLGLGPIVLSAIATFGYDITNPNWKNTLFNSKNVITPDKFRQTCLTVLFGIGYRLKR